MKYEINITEKVELNHIMTIDVPKGADIDNVLDNAQKGKRSMDEVKKTLTEQGCKILNYHEDSSRTSEIEIEDMIEIN